MSAPIHRLFLGGPVWAEKRWKGTFFPAKAKPAEFLGLYSRRLSTVEGHSTFRGIPSADTLKRWHDDTPEQFRFCLKFPRSISHDQRLDQAASTTAFWCERLRLLGDRAGPSFLQLPPSFSPARMDELASYLRTLPRDLPFALEVRSAGWFKPAAEEALSRLLTELGIARVNFDVRPLRAAPPTDELTREAQAEKPRVPVRFLRTAPAAFVRYVAHPVIAENVPWLDEWVPVVAAWLAEGDVYFCVQHPDELYAPSVCRLFHERLSASVPELPPLPEWTAPAAPVDPSAGEPEPSPQGTLL